MAGVTALLVIGYFATFYEHGQGHWRSVRFVEPDLQAKAQDVLKRSGAAWAQVKLDGQLATLTGVAPTEADRDDLIRDVREAAGPGGPWLGGVTQVRADIKIAAAIKPYTWSAVRGADGRVTLRGHVPGQRFRRSIAAEARKLFPTGVDDQVSVTAGHPTGPWGETAIWGLRQLSQLQDGDVQFVDSVITVRGHARDGEVQAAIYASAKAVARPYQGVADVTLSATVALPEAPKETAPVAPVTPAVQRLAAADCQKLIDEAMTDNVISFASGSAKLRPAALKLLDRMAQTGVDCGTLRFRVTGHTDATSIELGLGDLAQDRADATANYLTAKGIPAERLVTVGAGTSQPVGDNATVAGQARNRRVEITVLP
jgi:outer membrane protein OmpA-like peptidoglycan-associated protein